jgi:O-antigen/teichoic acid export membrane protein
MSTQAAALDAPVGVPERRPALAGAWVVSASMLGSGFLIYVFHVVAARSLTGADYGHIAVLWAAMFLAVIVLFRPLEQTTSRAVADRLARGEEVETVLRSVAVVSAVMLTVLLGACALAWNPIADRLFLGSGVMTVMLLVGIASYGIAYVLRGVVAGARWFGGYGLGLMADAVSRIAIAVPLVFVASRSVAAAAVAVAGLAGGLVPVWTGRRRLRATLRGTGGSRFRLRSTVAFAGPASLIAAADQLLVNGSPLLVTIEGGAARTAGIVFAATMLVRVPVYVFQGLASSILPNLARLQAIEDDHRFRRAVLQAVGMLLAFGVLVVAFAGLAGPEAMRLVYGPDFAVGRGDLLLLGTGVAFYLGATTFSQALLALDRVGRAATAWTLSAVLFVALYVALPGNELARIALAFAAATLLDLVVLAALLLAKTGRR